MNPNLQRAILLYQQSRFGLAEQELRQALAVDPDEPQAHALLAMCLAHAQKFEPATDEAKRAVHLAPEFSFAHYALASILHDRRAFRDALGAVQEALRLEPECADYYALQSQIQLDLRQWHEALAAAERGLELDSEHVACTNLRAIALVKLGRKAEAGATIDAALARHPDNAITHANQGWTLLETGDYPRALEHFRESLRLDPSNGWAREGLIEALKARSFVYSIFLRYLLWMSKLPPRTQWAIILGGYVGNRLLGGLAKANPALGPIVWPLRILYLAFVVLTWTADPLFNLMLRCNRFGRLALTDEQKTASNWVGGCVFLTLAGVVLCLFTGFREPFNLIPLVCGILIIPMAGTFKAAEGWPRRLMAGYTGIMALAGFAAMAMVLAMGGRDWPDTDGRAGLFSACLGVFLIGAIGSPWLANFLSQHRPRR